MRIGTLLWWGSPGIRSDPKTDPVSELVWKDVETREAWQAGGWEVEGKIDFETGNFFRLRGEVTAERYRRFERLARPLALYGLICFPPLVLLSLWHSVAVALHGEPLPPTVFALASMWGFTVVVSLLATLPPAIASLATDDELSSGARTGWAVAFFFTGFVASALFVLLRWQLERRTPRS